MFHIKFEEDTNATFPWVIRKNDQFLTSFEDEVTALYKLIELENNSFQYLNCNEAPVAYQNPLNFIDQAIDGEKESSLSIQHCRDGRSHFRGSVDNAYFMYLILDQSVLSQIKKRLPGINEFAPSRRLSD